MTAKRVLSVGQCGADHGSISRVLHTHFNADVIPAESADDALARLRKESFVLVLVNRIFDADGDSGLELIRTLKSDPGLKQIPVMLVSNYDDAQQEAAQAGAEPGFGKAALDQPRTLGRLQKCLKVI